jgi:putative transcriptional regulator
MTNFVLPSQHPADDLVTAYATGSLTGAQALVIATHLAFCPACRGRVAAAEAVCGEMFDSEAGDDVIAGEPPLHLRRLLEGAGTRWINVWFGVKELPVPGFEPQARLLWIPAGRRMPRHDHRGEELTLVLKGSFSDATGRYSAGDLQMGAPGLEHQPHAGDEGPCICLVAENGGLKLSGWLGRLVAWRGAAA